MKTKNTDTTEIGRFVPLVPFVTIAERKRAEQLAAEIKRLTRLAQLECIPFAEQAVEAAEISFLNDPTDQNFESLKNSHVHMGLIGRGIIPERLRAVIEASVARTEKNLRDYSRPILQRALDSARGAYKEAVAGEQAHHKSLVGQDLPPDPPPRRQADNQFGDPVTWRDSNAVLQAVQRPIRRLEQLITPNAECRQILSFLHEHAIQPA
jgi:hypothetical protein